MITVYYLPSPNGRKVTIALEEMGLPYEAKVLDVFKLEAQSPDYLEICPNGKIPAITEETDAGTIKVFESAAILQYLGRKTGLLYPLQDDIRRAWIDSWMFWQMASLGPSSGQVTWFRRAAQKQGRDRSETSLALHRFGKELARLYGVLERQLRKADYLCGEYSLADICSWTWVDQYGHYVGELQAGFPSTFAWHQRIADRPAVQRAMLVGKDAIEPPEDFRRAAASVEAQFPRGA